MFGFKAEYYFFEQKQKSRIQQSRQYAPGFVLVGSLELLELIGIGKASELWRLSGLEATRAPDLRISQITFPYMVEPFSPAFAPNCPFGYNRSGKG